MPTKEIALLLRDLEAAGPAYAALTTSLSQAIEELELRLNRLEGKVSVEVNDANNSVALSWDRRGEEWAIYYCTGQLTDDPFDESNWRPLTSAPIEVKAQAVPLLKELLAAILALYQKRTGEILKHRAILDELGTALQTEISEVPF